MALLLYKWFFLVSLPLDRKSTRLNSSHGYISYAVLCLKKKITVAAVVFIPLELAVPAAYGFPMLRFRVNRTAGIAIFLTYSIPSTYLIIPFCQFVGELS